MDRHLLLLMCLVAACDSGAASSKQAEKTKEPERKLAGVFADRFQCDSLTKTVEIAQILGGVKANKLESAMSTPKGVPQPCNYEVVMQSTLEYWTYDIDCRDHYKERADALFAQYKRTSGELVQQYDVMSDAGMIKPTDAGIEIKRPEDAHEVAVGAKALDHHGQGLLFIDDDAPCYVRVIGPDATRRLTLAQAVSKNLTFMNAPMDPRPLP
ncbi:MAG TPA: hypothetical protein VFV98_14930 [Vicinamibacterales bacterium]|nr:hypothetical protein [Vicinamibacterales bacterium]